VRALTTMLLNSNSVSFATELTSDGCSLHVWVFDAVREHAADARVAEAALELVRTAHKSNLSNDIIFNMVVNHNTATGAADVALDAVSETQHLADFGGDDAAPPHVRAIRRLIAEIENDMSQRMYQIAQLGFVDDGEEDGEKEEEEEDSAAGAAGADDGGAGLGSDDDSASDVPADGAGGDGGVEQEEENGGDAISISSDSMSDPLAPGAGEEDEEDEEGEEDEDEDAGAGAGAEDEEEEEEEGAGEADGDDAISVSSASGGDGGEAEVIVVED